MPEPVAGSVIQMGATGRYVNPLYLRVEDIEIWDIAQHLGNQCRYSGAVREFFSVGQHAVLCALALEDAGCDVEVVYTALHHDDSEAYLQDVARPLKEDPYFGKAYRGAEQRAEKIIAEALGLIYPYPPEIKAMDTVLLATERRDLMPDDGREWEILRGVVPLETKITPWSPRRSRQAFLQLDARLSRRRAT